MGRQGADIPRSVAAYDPMRRPRVAMLKRTSVEKQRAVPENVACAHAGAGVCDVVELSRLWFLRFRIRT